MFKRIISLTLCIALIFSLTACKSEKSESENKKVEVAKVGDEVITKDDFDNSFILMLVDDVIMGNIDKNSLRYRREVILDSMIRSELVKKYIDKNDKDFEVKDIDIDAEYNIVKQQVEAIKMYKIYFSQNNLLGENFKKKIKYQMYDKRFDDLILNEVRSKFEKEYLDKYVKFAASHILLKDEEKAKEVLEKAKAGENFSELAKEYSQGSSAEKGGSLGVFNKGQMIKPFEEALINNDVGLVDNLVKSKFGWHIIKISEKKKLKEIYDEIENNNKENDLTKKDEEVIDVEAEKTNYFNSLPFAQEEIQLLTMEKIKSLKEEYSIEKNIDFDKLEKEDKKLVDKLVENYNKEIEKMDKEKNIENKNSKPEEESTENENSQNNEEKDQSKEESESETKENKKQE